MNKVVQWLSLATATTPWEDRDGKVWVGCQHPRKWLEVEDRVSIQRGLDMLSTRTKMEAGDGLAAMATGSHSSVVVCDIGAPK